MRSDSETASFVKHEDCFVVYTVGHSNHDFNAFISLLHRNKIDVLIDVRSNPYSKYATHFNLDHLAMGLDQEGIEYVYMGLELGGRPESNECYDANGYVLYSVIAESPNFLDALLRLERKIEEARTAIMCGEENPTSCHRRLLVGRMLGKDGYEVMHIRGDGSVISEKELAAEEETSQMSLFKDEEVKLWRSTQSVSPRRALRSSSVYSNEWE